MLSGSVRVLSRLIDRLVVFNLCVQIVQFLFPSTVECLVRSCLKRKKKKKKKKKKTTTTTTEEEEEEEEEEKTCFYFLISWFLTEKVYWRKYKITTRTQNILSVMLRASPSSVCIPCPRIFWILLSRRSFAWKWNLRSCLYRHFFVSKW